VSWSSTETGRSREGLEELDRLLCPGHNFLTVKPLNLFKKIIQLWCPIDGVVLDPYAGSGTAGHAVLDLNFETGSRRRFIPIEQGSPGNRDKYARTLTSKRLHNAITGERPSGNGADPLGGGFEFRTLTRQIDAKTVLSMKKDELVDVVITSHWDETRRSSPNLIRIEDPRYSYLVGKDDRSEGYFIIWNNGGPVGQLDRDTYRLVLKDAERQL
jgi:adenine-specific DNA-methyltransferase